MLDQLRRVVEHPRSDGELLTCFIEQRDEKAFEALVRRHGPMILGVCSRILRNAHHAEDAFQATFLVLVRKATSVRPRDAVGNWLYGVAYRTALDCQRRLARQRAKERQVDMPQLKAKEEDNWRELLPLLDQELHRLPDKYRLAVILCEMEGRSRKEVAHQLNIPEGTLSSRLATARKRLAARLARYGFVISGASLATLLTENAVPASLLLSTTKAAMLIAVGQAATGVVSSAVATLTKGVLQTMILAKLKTATMVLFGVGVLGLGTGGLMYQSRAGASDGQAIDDRPTQDQGGKRAEQARDREQALREELERARIEIAKLRNEARAQRAEEEEQRLRAEKAVQEARAQLDKARQQAERARYAEAVQKAQQALKDPDLPKRPGRFEDQKRALEGLDLMEAKLRRDFQEQLKKLEEQHRKELEQLRLRRVELLGKQKLSQPNRANESADKLDRILERLERLEKRLDNLEGRKK
jgi:RNA polymerase sigma factor (sigma-70 family)